MGVDRKDMRVDRKDMRLNVVIYEGDMSGAALSPGSASCSEPWLPLATGPSTRSHMYNATLT